MFNFENPNYLYLILFLIPFFFLPKISKYDITHFFNKKIIEEIFIFNNSFKKRTRLFLIVFSLIFMIIAMARPQINNGTIKVDKQLSNLVVGFDISKSMFAKDVYPDRFTFAKEKFKILLKNFKDSRIGVIGFSSQPFMVSPLTEDFNSLKFLTHNLNTDTVSLKGTNILSFLQAANELLGKQKVKNVLIFTDGGEQKDFSKEISYAKENNIHVYVYLIGTEKGAPIKTINGFQKDNQGNIVIVKRNESIKSLSEETGGIFEIYSFNSSDLNTVINSLQSKNNKIGGTEEIKDKKELFYYPLIIAILFLFLSMFSLPEFIKLGERK